MIVLGMVAMVTCATAQVPMVMFQWSIDLEQGIISMTFSRDVDLDSVNFDGISLVSTAMTLLPHGPRVETVEPPRTSCLYTVSAHGPLP